MKIRGKNSSYCSSQVEDVGLRIRAYVDVIINIVIADR